MDATLTNNTASATTSWTVTFAWPTDISPWNGVRLAYTGGKVTIGNATWNGSIARGSTANFGFSDSSATLPKPTSLHRDDQRHHRRLHADPLTGRPADAQTGG